MRAKKDDTLTVSATDHYGNVTVVEEWSEGAVDMYGVLQTGELHSP